MKKIHFSIIVVTVLSMLLAACGGTATTEAPPPTAVPAKATDVPEEVEPIVIGASLPLTGMFAIPGAGHRDGYQLWAELVNEKGGLLGRPVELIITDNRSDTAEVVSQYERFINVDKVDALLGTFSTLLSFPTSSLTEQAQMVYLEPSDSSLMSHSRGYTYNFGFTLKPIDYIGQTPVDALIHYRDAGLIPADEFPTTVALIYKDDFFPNGISRGLLGGTLEIPGTDLVVDFSPGYLEEVGLELVYIEKFPQEFNDWISLATSVKDSGAEYLFVLTTPPNEVDIVRALQTVGYNPKATFFAQGTYPEFLEALGDEGTNGIQVWTTWDPTIQWEGLLAGESFSNQDFVEAFKAHFDHDPDEDGAQSFAVAQALEQAIQATGSTDNTALRDWFAARTADDPVRTVQGDYYWDEKGLTAGRDVLLLQWQEGELKFIFPVGEFPGTADMVWPKPEW